MGVAVDALVNPDAEGHSFALIGDRLPDLLGAVRDEPSSLHAAGCEQTAAAAEGGTMAHAVVQHQDRIEIRPNLHVRQPRETDIGALARRASADQIEDCANPAHRNRIATTPLEPARMFEKPFEKLLFACRWLLAPLYIGLAIALIALGVKFFQEAIHVLMHVGSLKEADLILTTLALIDIVLVGSLIVMVMFSGYENFVSRIDAGGAESALSWLGKLDAGTLKLKVAASIVAISSIHLLRIFMNAPQVQNDKILWYVILHLTFVVSALLLGVLDRMSFAGHREQ